MIQGSARVFWQETLNRCLETAHMRLFSPITSKKHLRLWLDNIRHRIEMLCALRLFSTLLKVSPMTSLPRAWISPRNPEFVKKAAPVLDLYEGLWRGRPLSANEFVLSADEKTSIQARIRKHRTLPPSGGRPAYVEHEYQRGGALNYLAAWD